MARVKNKYSVELIQNNMKRIENGSIKKYLTFYINSPKSKQLNIFSVNAIVKILNGNLNHYYIFSNDGGRDFDIWYNNDIFWKDSEKQDAVTLSANSIDMRQYIIFKSINGDEYYNENINTNLHDAIKRILFPNLMMDELIIQIKYDMDVYGFLLTENQITKYIDEQNIIVFDTFERDNYINYISTEITGMSYPQVDDLIEYKMKFYDVLKENIHKSGYRLKLKNVTN